MNKILKLMLAIGIACIFALPFLAQDAFAHHYTRPYWQHYGNSYGQIHHTGHYSYTHAYGWSGWNYHRVRYSYHYPYRYTSYGHPYAYFHPGWTRHNYGWHNSYAYSWYPITGRYW